MQLVIVLSNRFLQGPKRGWEKRWGITSMVIWGVHVEKLLDKSLVLRKSISSHFTSLGEEGWPRCLLQKIWTAGPGGKAGSEVLEYDPCIKSSLWQVKCWRFANEPNCCWQLYGLLIVAVLEQAGFVQEMQLIQQRRGIGIKKKIHNVHLWLAISPSPERWHDSGIL